ncbi:hypothetical protein CQA53_11465, partial [Helicobacter didelphidarum]
MRSLYVGENNQTIDAQELENQGYTDIHFQGIHLTGGTESNKPHNECFFGELDSNDSNMGFNTNKPIYYLQGNEDLSNKDSNTMDCHADKSARNDKNISTSTLQIFLHSSTLTILHYSLIHSSLHIKLECNSKESQEIEEKEKALLESKAKDSKENKEIISTAFLCPILEDNELKCPHNGRVKLKSKKGKSF